MSNSINILATKKLKPSIIELALKEAIIIKEQEFIEVRLNQPLPTIDELTKLKEHIVFTSRHAVQAMEQTGFDFQAKKILCLNGETLQSVKNLINADIVATAANAVDLAKQIISETNIKSLSFVCGEKRRDELPLILKQNGVDVEEWTVYNTIYKTALVQQGYEALLFFSPSAVESFFQSNILLKNVPCFCVGNTTAATVKDHTINPVLVAEEPTQESVIKSVKEFFIKKKITRA